MGRNTSKGIRVIPALEWKRFDALPREIREVYAAAPFDFAMVRSEDERKAHARGVLSVGQWRRNTIHWMCDFLQHRARKDYGPDHPDAERSRLANSRGAR